MLNYFQGKKILITGHTGFKGSWLSLILKDIGSEVFGISLEPPIQYDSMFNLLKINTLINSSIIDIRNEAEINKKIKDIKPEIVFHMAAQPFVRRSYKDPIETWSTNVMGTLNVLQACQETKAVRAIVNITTDKCYDNKEWCWPYRESDELGGHDPYSASKAAVEILSQSYRKSFLQEKGIQMATVRAGNVIGGGDFGEDRLIPSIIRSIQKKEELILRSPNSVRPWQHVMEALFGYIMVAHKLCISTEFDKAYNFGPDINNQMNVLEVVQELNKNIDFKYIIKEDSSLHEAGLLILDNSFVKQKIGWKPTLNITKSLEFTSKWYKQYLSGNVNLLDFTRTQIQEFTQLLYKL